LNENVDFSSVQNLITRYRSPSGNFQYFIDNLEKFLSMIYSNNTETICGDININYLIDSTQKQLLDLLLAFSMCPGVDSVSKNEYQVNPGAKAAGA
jgi:hypothetical protein